MDMEDVDRRLCTLESWRRRSQSLLIGCLAIILALSCLLWFNAKAAEVQIEEQINRYQSMSARMESALSRVSSPDAVKHDADEPHGPGTHRPTSGGG